MHRLRLFMGFLRKAILGGGGGVVNGLLLEDNTSYTLLEDNTSILLLE